MFKKTVLTNGLRIITVPMQGTNTITVLVLCGTGSDYESRDINGISHFLEHMFFKGTKKRPTPEMIVEELDGMGSISNAFTSNELTGYHIKAGKTYLNNSLEILADIYNNSLLKAEEIERERQVIIEEMHQNQDNPRRYIWEIWDRLLYGDQPAGWKTIGEENIIRRLSQEDFANYFTHQYVASNTAIVVAGNFEENVVTETIKSLFSEVRDATPFRKKPNLTELQTVPGLEIHHKKTDQTHIIIGFRGYDASHTKRYAADILGVILGGGMSSRMFNRIREKLGLAYTVWTAHESYSNRGYLTTYTGVAHQNTEKTIRAVLEEYKRIRDELVAPAELRRVKDYIRGTMLIGLEASDAVASFVGGEEMLTGKPLTIEEVFAKIDAVTVEDIRDVAKEIIRPEKLNLAMIGPAKDGKKLENLLKL